MNKETHMITTLTLIAVISALLLSYVYSFTQPKIEADKRAKLQSVLEDALPLADEFTSAIPDTLWYGLKDTDTIGVVFKVWPRGYGGLIELTVGVDKELKITGLIPGEDLKETPGLGLKLREEWFQKQFIGKDEKSAQLKQDGGEIDAITAATISSRAVASGVSGGMTRYCGYIKQDPRLLLYPEARSFIEVIKDTVCYAITDTDTVIIIATEGEGYGGTIKVGMAFRDKKLTRIKILAHNETEGYGARITDTTFLNNIIRGKPEAITGATISSKAVFEAVEMGRKILARIK